nr:immunoglobulin light chain junction region [Macaca mulatta]MOX09409.1 immunoglobulin light chain junction region [Macaca mulatta]MOX24410.1 immunoglobulin light chain junction region [Macaca mulatta]MOX27458.1 immunoglobulin light chain junction region [Macaca mulatta]
CMEALEFPLTF